MRAGLRHGACQVSRVSHFHHMPVLACTDHWRLGDQNAVCLLQRMLSVNPFLPHPSQAMLMSDMSGLIHLRVLLYFHQAQDHHDSPVACSDNGKQTCQ